MDKFIISDDSLEGLLLVKLTSIDSLLNLFSTGKITVYKLTIQNCDYVIGIHFKIVLDVWECMMTWMNSSGYVQNINTFLGVGLLYKLV